jgi:L-fuculose-phosphate aldolase
VSKLPATYLGHMKKSDGEGFIGFWESSVRAELRADPTLLDQVR